MTKSTDYLFAECGMAATLTAAGSCPASTGPRGCPGPRGPEGPQPPLSDSLDNDDSETAASSRAVKILADRLSHEVDRIGRHIRTSAPDTGLVIHVRQGGNDASSGESATTALATPLAAVARLLHCDARGDIGVTIQFGPGVFDSAQIDISPRHGAVNNHILFRGSTDETGTPLTTLNRTSGNQAVRTWGPKFSAYDMVLAGGAYICDGSVCSLDNVILDSQDRFMNLLSSVANSSVWLKNAVSLRGDADRALVAHGGGLIRAEANTFLRFIDSPSYTICAMADYQGCMMMLNQRPTGNFVGQKWVVDRGGVVATGDTDPDEWFPGTIDGQIRRHGKVAPGA